MPSRRDRADARAVRPRLRQASDAERRSSSSESFSSTLMSSMIFCFAQRKLDSRLTHVVNSLPFVMGEFMG